VTRRRWLLGPTVALVGTLALSLPVVAQTEIEPEAFLESLRRAQEVAMLGGQDPSILRMAELRAALGLPVHVVLDDWSVEIRHDRLLDALSGATAEDFRLAGERLAALERSLTDAVARERASPDRLAAALDGAFRGVVPPRPDPLQVVLGALDDAFQSVMRRLGPVLAGAGSVLAVIALFGVLAMVALFLMPSRLVPDRVARRTGLSGNAGQSVDWAARADEALRSGDRHEAVRALYLALLASLAGKGILDDAPALTAGEARFAVQRRRPALLPSIARATESYERVIYGGATPDDRDIEHLRAATTRARER
jgi:Domain of unknown function (DUF4129)